MGHRVERSRTDRSASSIIVRYRRRSRRTVSPYARFQVLPTASGQLGGGGRRDARDDQARLGVQPAVGDQVAQHAPRPPAWPASYGGSAKTMSKPVSRGAATSARPRPEPHAPPSARARPRSAGRRQRPAGPARPAAPGPPRGWPPPARRRPSRRTGRRTPAPPGRPPAAGRAGPPRTPAPRTAPRAPGRWSAGSVRRAASRAGGRPPTRR